MQRFAVAADIAAIAIGGAFGAVLRYGATLLAGVAAGGPTVLATLGVNLVGCFLIGLLAEAVALEWPLSGRWQLALRVGVLGSLTTFSAFGLEAHSLGHQGRPLASVIYVAVSVGVGIAAVAGGIAAARWWLAGG